MNAAIPKKVVSNVLKHRTLIVTVLVFLLAVRSVSLAEQRPAPVTEKQALAQKEPDELHPTVDGQQVPGSKAQGGDTPTETQRPLAASQASESITDGAGPSREFTETSRALTGQGQAQRYTESECEVQPAQAAPARQCATPPPAGLALLRNDAGHYDLWRPATWQVRNLSDFLVDGVLLTPNEQNQGARFFIRATDTSAVITVDDLIWRIGWFNDLLQRLPDAQVQWQAHWINSNVTGFEAMYTYHDGDTVTKRWMRLLYVGTQQYWLVAEAPSIAEFDSLKLMFGTMMLTFHPDDQVNHVAMDMCAA